MAGPDLVRGLDENVHGVWVVDRSVYNTVHPRRNWPRLVIDSVVSSCRGASLTRAGVLRRRSLGIGAGWLGFGYGVGRPDW